MSKDDPEANCLPTAFRARRPIRGRSCRRLPAFTSCLKAIFTAIARSSSIGQPSCGSESHLVRRLRRQMGRRRAGSGFGRVQRPVLVRFRRPSSHRKAPRDRTLHTSGCRSSGLRNGRGDPGAYTRPFTMYGHSTLQAGDELMEYICNENNKDVSHIVGKDPRNQLGLK